MKYIYSLAIAALTLAYPVSRADEIDIVVNGGSTPITFRPFDATMDASSGAHIWLSASTDSSATPLRATQRELGFREVDYKAKLFSLLGNVPDANTSTVSNNGITTVTFGSSTAINATKNSTYAIGYWVGKDVPVVIGPDGNAYITDGHHTTAGFLASAPTTPINATPGTGVTTPFPVLGHVVASYYNAANGPVAPDASFWNAMNAANNSYLYGPNGGILAGTGLISSDTTSVPLIPGKTATTGTAMVNDLYRSLAWGMADGIIANQVIKFNKYTNGSDTTPSSTSSGTAGFLKVNSTAAGQPDVNFVEFFYADYVRGRVTWDDTATPGAGQANAINAPVNFYAAVANANALVRSELFKDASGHNVTYYTASTDANVASWAQANVKNGLATSGDKYDVYLLDNSSIQGDISLSANSAENKVHIDTTAGQDITSKLINATRIDINAGSSITTKWKDSGMNGQNTTMTIAAGSGAVSFFGDNDYSRLANLNIAAGSLHISNPSNTSIAATITGAGAFFKEGNNTLNLTGSLSGFSGATTVSGGLLKINGTSAFAGSVTVQNGASLGGAGTISGAATIASGGHLAPGNSPGAITFSGGLTLSNNAVLDFEVGNVASDSVLVTGGSFSVGNGITINLTDAGDFSVGSYTLIDFSTGAIVSSPVNASSFTIGSAPVGFSYSLNVVGNQLQLTSSAVPEPAVASVLAGALVLGFASIRRRR